MNVAKAYKLFDRDSDTDSGAVLDEYIGEYQPVEVWEPRGLCVCGQRAITAESLSRTGVRVHVCVNILILELPCGRKCK